MLDKQLRPGMARSRNAEFNPNHKTNMKSRNGKIARLPLEIRERLNIRLADGEPGNRLVEWLNSNPDVMKVMVEHFEGRPITDGNLSEWRAGGYEIGWIRLDWARFRPNAYVAQASQPAAARMGHRKTPPELT
jgi:hypothetical protein